MIRFPLIGRACSRSAAPILRWAGGVIAAGLVLAALGPFGSYMNGDLFQRAAYWTAAMLLGAALYGTALRAVVAFVPAGSRAWWPSLIGASLLTGVPEALATRAWAFLLWPELAQLGPHWPLWFAQTTTFGLVMTLGAAFVLRHSESVAKDEPAPSRFFAPGVGALGKDVLALQVEDHYVRVHRTNGSELILVPLVRAIEFVKAEGLQTHRSWWVASHAVTGVEGNARSMRLRLSNGLVAPVARSAVIRLRAAGWLPHQASHDHWERRARFRNS